MRAVQVLHGGGVPAPDQLVEPAGEDAGLALEHRHGHHVVSAVRQPGRQTGDLHTERVAHALAHAEAGHGTQGLVDVLLHRALAEADGQQVGGQTLGLTARVLGVGDAETAGSSAGQVRDGADVAAAPGALEHSTVTVGDLQGGGDLDAAALLHREVGLLGHTVGGHTGGPDQGVGVELAGVGLVLHVDQLHEVALGAGERGVQQDLDAARLQVLHHAQCLVLGDLRHDPAHGLDQHDAGIGLGQARVLGDGGADDVLHLRDGLDAGEASAHDHEGQGTALLLGVGHGGRGLDALQDLVAQGLGLLNGLQADAGLSQTRDGEGARGGTGGHHDVLVRDLELRAVLGLHRGGLARVLDLHDLADHVLGGLQVRAAVHHGVAGLDVTAHDLWQEGLVGHVRQRVDDGDHTAARLDLLLEVLGDVEAGVAAADDQDAGLRGQLRGKCHTVQGSRRDR